MGYGLLALAMPGTGEVLEEAGYVGDAACRGCHAALLPEFEKTVHARAIGGEGSRAGEAGRNCESCHGPGLDHVRAGGGVGTGGERWVGFGDGAAESAERRSAVCLTCHSSARQRHWAGSAHESGDLDCTSCHTLMRNVSGRHQLSAASEAEACAQCHLMPRSQSLRKSHMPVRTGIVEEGFLTCSSCHNAHGTIADALVDAHTVNDKCISCHAEKRGPFLWEHPPVTENCLNCHDPHGTITEAMLKVAPPRLCQTCHVASLHPSEAQGPDDRMVVSRSCGNCHQAVHGSNHPSGMALTR